ncbi:MAG: hypothetical protein MPJ06_05695 [Nitrosopumilus sp.]|nr:hypothetical protein [Nitrosopumilus sp.]MDA7959807.1 hypothetical protein [Nitrosopumilus sp.]
MSGIRVTYTGLVSFASRIAIVLGNAAFMLIITRTLPVEEYGAWGIISTMLVYAVSAEVAVGYWASREVARGEDSGRTAVASSAALSAGGVAAYAGFALAVGSHGGVGLEVMLLAALLVPLRYVSGTLVRVNLGWRPHANAYALAAQCAAQIPLALYFVYHLGWGIPGVVAAFAISHAVCCAVLAAYAREKLRGPLEARRLSGWLRLSWVSVYPEVASVLYRLDVILFVALAGPVAVVASWTAALTVAFTVIHSALIATAIYPKLLGGDGTGHVRGNMTLFLYVAIPMAAMVISLAGPALYALNPAYAEAHMALALLAVGMFFTAASVVFHYMLEGNEKVDAAGGASAGDYARSNLFLTPSINVVQHGTYLAVLAAGFVILSGAPAADVLLFWGIAAVATGAPFTAYRYVLARREVGLRLEAAKVAKYLAAAACSFGAVHVAQLELLRPAGIFEFMPVLLGLAAAGMAGYAAITLAADPGTRSLARGIVAEIRRR